MIAREAVNLNPGGVGAGKAVVDDGQRRFAEQVAGGGLQMTESCSVEIENQAKPACVAEIIMRLYF